MLVYSHTLASLPDASIVMTHSHSLHLIAAAGCSTISVWLNQARIINHAELIPFIIVIISGPARRGCWIIAISTALVDAYCLLG